MRCNCGNRYTVRYSNDEGFHIEFTDRADSFDEIMERHFHFARKKRVMLGEDGYGDRNVSILGENTARFYIVGAVMGNMPTYGQLLNKVLFHMECERLNERMREWMKT